MKGNADYVLNLEEVSAMMKAKGVELEPEPNEYQEGSVLDVYKRQVLGKTVRRNGEQSTKTCGRFSPRALNAQAYEMKYKKYLKIYDALKMINARCV